MSDLANILETINQKIDGEKFARLINYYPDRIQIVPPTLKCFCPVHQERAFRSLNINLTTHTYKCTMRHCSAFKGGTFVDFWSEYRNLSPVEAALDLSEKLKLDIDVNLLKRLGMNYREDAEKALAAGDAAEARKLIDEALALDGRNVELKLLSAQISEAMGQTRHAAQERLAIVDLHIEAGSTADAEKLLDALINGGEVTEATLTRQVDLARASGKPKRLLSALMQLADFQEGCGELAQAAQLLSEAAALDKPKVAMLDRLAKLYHQVGDRAAGLNILDQLEELHTKAGNAVALLETLRRRAFAKPDDLSIRVRIADLLAESGEITEARQERLKLVEAYASASQFTEAEALMAQMLEAQPDDVDLLESQARLRLSARDKTGAVEIYRRLAAISRATGAEEKVQRYLDQACTVDPDNLELRRDQAEWKLTRGNLDGGINDLFTLADRCFELKRTPLGIEILERIAELARTDLDKRLRIGRALERHQLADEAYASYCDLVAHLMQNQRYDAAQAICDEAQRLRPLDPRTLELRIETHLALNRRSEAIEACRDVASQFMAAGDAVAAEAALQRAIKLDRAETQPKHDLAVLYEKTNRPELASALWLEMALFHRAQSRHDGANEAIREALRLNPENRDARIMLAEGLEATGHHEEALAIWKQLGLDIADDERSAPEALKLLRHALELDPSDRHLLGSVTRMTLAQEGLDAALGLFNKWLDLMEGESDSTARIEAYRYAVQSDPKRGPWRARLADLLYDNGARSEAAEHYEHLLEQARAVAGDLAAQAPLLEKLVDLRPESVELRREYAALLAKLGRKSESVEILRELAARLLRNADLAPALDLLNEALIVSPDHPELLAQTAELTERSGQIEEAATVYERLAELYRKQSERSRSIPVLEKLLAFEPKRADWRRELAEIYEQEGDIDRAVEQNYRLAQAIAQQDGPGAPVATLCRKIRAMAPDFIPARELLIDSCVALAIIQEAKDELDKLGDLALGDGQLDRAERYFKRIQELDPEDIGSGERLGKLYEAGGRTDDAATAFEHVLEIYEKLSEQARAINVMQKLKQLRPDDLDLRGRLARALLAASNDRREAGQEWLELISFALERGEHDAVQVSMEEARPYFKRDWTWRGQLLQTLGTHPNGTDLSQVWNELVRDALEAREYEIARDTSNEALERFPDSIELREGRVEAHRRSSNYEAAAEDLCELALRFEVEEDYETARGYLMQALELQPRSIALMEMLAENQVSSGQIDAAFTTINRMIDQHRQEGDHEHAILRGRRLLELRPEDLELKDFLAGLLNDAGRTDEAVTILRSIADDLATAGDVETAQARYARLVDLAPRDIEILRRHADLTYEKGGMHEALSLYDRLMDAMLSRGDAPAIEAEFNRILDMEPGHLRMKERLAAFLNERGRTDESRLALLEVIAAYRDDREELEEAVRVLRQLKSMDPENLEVRAQEAELLERMQKPEEAAKIWRQVAATHRRAGDLDRACATLARCAELDADNAAIQLETAELFEKQGEIEKATSYFLRAIEIHDREERLDKCVPILERAIFLNPLRHDLSDALARIHERLGQTEEAVDVWLSLAEQLEGAGDCTGAVAIYHHLRLLDPKDQEGRRRLAALHELAGESTAALAELRELAVLAHDAEQHETEAGYLNRILALDAADAISLKALAAVWKALDNEEKLFSALSRLERLQTAQGALAEAIETLDQLKALRPEDPELVTRSIELLIKTGKGDQAAQYGISLIQLYFSRGEDNLAIDTLRRIAEIEPGNIERRVSLARLLHSNGREEAAQQEFYLTASKLAGDEDWASCLGVCEAGIELFPDDVRLRDLMGRTLLKLGRRAEAIEVQLHLAALYDGRGDSPRAQRVYETILAEQPDHQGTREAMIEWALRHENYPLAIENLVQLAESHYLLGRLDRAIDSMERIQTLDPARMDLKARLAEIYFEAGDEAGARSTWLAAARGMVMRGEAEPAIPIYERLVKLKPNDSETLAALCEAYAAAGRDAERIQAAVGLADLYAEEGRADEGRQLLENLGERHPDDVAIWERLAALYMAQKQEERAAGAWRRLFEIHRAGRRLDQARQCLESALAITPEDPELLEAMGDICLALGRRPEGLENLERAARALQGWGEHDRGRELCQRVLKLDPLNLTVRHLHATLLEAAGDWPAAVEDFLQAARGHADAHQNAPALEIISHVLQREPYRIEERELYAKLLQREQRTDEAVEQYGILLDTLGDEEDPRRAIKYCRQILTDRPEHPGAHIHLSRVYERTDKPRQAFKEYEWLVDHYLGRSLRTEAEAVIEKGLALFPEDPGMRTRLIDLQIATGRNGEAARNLSELAEAAQARSDAKTTLWALSRACEIEPDNLEHRTRLADSHERVGEIAEARRVRLELIEALLARTRILEARELADRVVDSIKEDEALRRKVAKMFEEAGVPEVSAYHFHYLARRAMERSEYKVAQDLCRHVLELKARHVGARETLIEALLALKNNQAAADEYNLLCDIYDEAGEHDAAHRALRALIDLVPTRPEPRRKLIDLYRKLHRQEEMVDQLRRLAEIYVNENNHDGAVVCLRELIEERPDDTHARVRYIDLFSQIGDEAELWDDYLHLARILTRKGQVVEATRTYEKMILLNPHRADCRDEFVQFLFDQGQVSRALEETRELVEHYRLENRFTEAGRALERALNFAPEEQELRERLADIYLRNNRRGLALETYRALSRVHEQAGDEKRLIQVLEKILEIDSLSVEFRQRLADLYLKHSLAENACTQFRILAEQYMERGLYDLAENEYRNILEQEPENVELWERVVETHLRIGVAGEIIPDLMMLAELYNAGGRLKDSVGIYKSILECEPDNIDILTRYIDAYMQIGLEQNLIDDYLHLADLRVARGEMSEAIKIYKHLMEIAPDNPLVSERLTATQQMFRSRKPSHPRSETGTGARVWEDDRSLSDPSQSKVVGKVIRNYENVLKLNPQNVAARVKLAELLEKAGNLNAADQHWAEAAQTFLSRGDLDRSIELCEKYLERHPEDPKIRERLSRAMVQRDSLRAIDGALADELRDF